MSPSGSGSSCSGVGPRPVRWRKNSLISSEPPYLACETLQSRKFCATCSHCQRPFEWKDQLYFALHSREKFLEKAEQFGYVRCTRRNCPEVYCDAGCRDDDEASGHALLCTGVDMAKKADGDVNYRLIRNFIKYSYRSNEMYLSAARLIARWIARAHTVAKLASSEEEASDAFEVSIKGDLDNFFSLFPCDAISKPQEESVESYSSEPNKKRSRLVGSEGSGGHMGVASSQASSKAAASTMCSDVDRYEAMDRVRHSKSSTDAPQKDVKENEDDTSSDGYKMKISDTSSNEFIVNQQVEESWILLRGALLYGRCRDWTTSFLNTCKYTFEYAPEEVVPMGISQLFFCKELWECVLASLQRNLVPLSVPSPMNPIIKSLPSIVNSSERLAAAMPFLTLFSSFLHEEMGPAPTEGAGDELQSHLERKVVRLAQSVSSPDGEAIFARYRPNFLTLVPRLVVRTKRSKRIPRNASHSADASGHDSQNSDYEDIQHSCVPNSQVEGSVAESADSEFHSSLRCNVIALRDIFHKSKAHHPPNRRLPGCVDVDEGITLSRLAIQSTSSSEVQTDSSESRFSTSSSGRRRKRQNPENHYQSRRKALEGLYFPSFLCPCSLCIYERVEPRGFLDLNINSLYEPLLRGVESSDRGQEPPAIEPRSLPFTVSSLNEPHSLALEFGEAILYNLGQYYMQEGRFDEAIAVYNEIVKVCHHNFHNAKNAGTEPLAFDATCYYFLSSALLDAGLTLDALNVWAVGYAMDPNNPLLRTQRHKDNSIICTNAEVVPFRKPNDLPDIVRSADGMPSRLFQVVTRPDDYWVRNSLGLPLSSEDYAERKKFLSANGKHQSNVIDKSSLVHVHGMGVYSSIAPVMSAEDAAAIIRVAEEYAAAVVDTPSGPKPRGWSTERHYDAPTTDIPVHALPEVLNLFNNMMLKSLGPLICALHKGTVAGTKNTRVYVNDAFVVKYSLPETAASEDKIYATHVHSAAPSNIEVRDVEVTTAQRYLPVHTDQSEYSFTIALNSIDEYEGGGTYFVDLGQAVNVDRGHCITFPGGLRHGGDPITSGVRYIIAVFLFVSDEAEEAIKSSKYSRFGSNSTSGMSNSTSSRNNSDSSDNTGSREGSSSTLSTVFSGNRVSSDEARNTDAVKPAGSAFTFNFD